MAVKHLNAEFTLHTFLRFALTFPEIIWFLLAELQDLNVSLRDLFERIVG